MALSDTPDGRVIARLRTAMDRIPNGTIVIGTRDDIAGHRHEITGYDSSTGLYMAGYLPAGPLTAAGAASPGLERELHAHEFETLTARLLPWADDPDALALF
jgi:hypothetical protein